MNAEQLLESFCSWMRRETTIATVDGYYEITTPFLNSANDALQIYVKQDGDRLLLSDDGFTLHDPSAERMPLPGEEKTRLGLRFGVAIGKNGEITASCDLKDFPQKMLTFIQAVMLIGDVSLSSLERGR